MDAAPLAHDCCHVGLDPHVGHVIVYKGILLRALCLQVAVFRAGQEQLLEVTLSGALFLFLFLVTIFYNILQATIYWKHLFCSTRYRILMVVKIQSPESYDGSIVDESRTAEPYGWA